MGATGETSPGGSRREGADEAVMEALRERITTLEAALREIVNAYGSQPHAEPMWWDRMDKASDEARQVLATPEPQARHPEAARPPEPGAAPSGAPTGDESGEASVLRELLNDTRSEFARHMVQWNEMRERLEWAAWNFDVGAGDDRCKYCNNLGRKTGHAKGCWLDFPERSEAPG